MKKLSLLLCAVLALCCMGAAATTDFENALMADITSANVQFTMKTTLDEKLPETVDPEGELNALLSSLAIDCDMEFSASSDGKAMDCHYTMKMPEMTDVPATSTEAWTKLDISNAENPVYQIIMKNQPADETFGDKYLVMDFLQLDGMKEMIGALSSAEMFDPEFSKTLNEQLIKSVDITPEVKDGVYTIVLSQADLKTIVGNLADVIADLLFDNTSMTGMLSSIGANLNMTKDEFKAEAKKLTDAIASSNLFDEKEAVKIEVTLGDDKQLSTLNMILGIDTSAAEIMKIAETFGAETGEYEDFALDFNLIYEMKFSNINEEIAIEFPEITVENSINLLEQTPDIPEVTKPEEGKFAVYYNSEEITYENDPVFENNMWLIPLRKTANAFGITDENITYDDATGAISVKGEGLTLELKIGSSNAVVNGSTVSIGIAADTISDRTYLPLDFIAEIFNKNSAVDTLTGNTGANIYLSDAE